MPVKATEHSAGYDIFSAESTKIPPHSQILISTDISAEIPMGYFGLL